MRCLLCFLIFLSYFNCIEAQGDDQRTFWQNVRYGGGIGLNFGSGFFSGTVAPSAIYDFNPYVSAGAGLTGSYNSIRNDFKSTVLGGSLIALTNPFPEIQLSAEFEQLNVRQTFDNGLNPDTKDNFWASALFLGIGYRSGNVTVGIRYDVLYDENESIYADPILPFVRFWF